MAEQVVPGCLRIRLNGVNAYLVDTDADGLVLIDTGAPFLHPGRILRSVQTMGFTANDIGDILITHQHIDHAGGLAQLATATGARVHVHALDASEIEAGDPARPGFGRSALMDFVASSSRWVSLRAVGIDNYIEDGAELVGSIGIRAIHTPGHTDGHTAFLWPDHGGVLFAGDAAANWRGRLGHAPIAADWDQVQESLEKLVGFEFAVAAFGHGSVARGDLQTAFKGLIEQRS